MEWFPAQWKIRNRVHYFRTSGRLLRQFLKLNILNLREDFGVAREALEGYACVSKISSASRLNVTQKYTSAHVEITQVEISYKKSLALAMTEAIA